MSSHRIENDQQLVHAGGQGDFAQFACCYQSFAGCFDDEVVPGGRQCGHVQGYTHGRATTLSNSKETLYRAQTTSRSGVTAQVTWAISFKSAYKGTKNLYLCVKDQAGLTEGNVNKRTWTIN